MVTALKDEAWVRRLGWACLAISLGCGVWLASSGGEETRRVRLSFEFFELKDLHAGAPVRISGVLAGRVESIEYTALEVCGARHGARLTVALRAEMLGSIRRDAELFLTSVGPLGEQHVEIDPGARTHLG